MVFTRTADKLDEAVKLGIAGVLESDGSAMTALAGHFDFMLSTVPEKHDINPFIALLKRDRTLVICGALESMPPVENGQVAFHRKSVSGSLIGSLAETREVLDFCAEHGIAPAIQLIPISEINDACAPIIAGDVRFRHVIDMASLKPEHAD